MKNNGKYTEPSTSKFSYGRFTRGRMPFRMFSEYECWCSVSVRTVFGKHSVYYWSILPVRFRTDVYGTAFSSSNNLLLMFKIIFINLPNVACRCIREVFGKHSRNIRRVRKTFGKHTSSSWCIRNEHLEVLGSVCFPNTPNWLRTWRMLPEYECWCSGSERTVFGKHPVYSRSILALRFRTDAYGTAFGSSKMCCACST
jgi:hypothetical protein